MKNIKQKIYSLVKKSEKWTKTDMVYLAKNGSWIALSRSIGIISAFLLSIAYANLLPKETYGLYKYTLSIAGLLGIFSLPGINTSLIRSISLGHEGSFGKALKTKVKWGFLGLVVGLSVSGYYFFNGNLVIASGFLIASFFVPITEVFNISGCYLQGKKLFKTSAMVNSIKSILFAIAIVSTIFFTKNIVLILLAFYFSTLIFQIAIYLYIFKKYKRNNSIDNSTISFGKHLSLISIIEKLAMHIDKILMWHLLGPAKLAVYAFATLPVIQLNSLLKIIPTLSFPKLTVQNRNELKKTLPQKTMKLLLLLIIPVIIYYTLAPLLFKLLFPEYLEAIKYSQIYSLSILTIPLGMFATTITAKAHKRYLYIIKTINPSIKIILYAMLIPAFGINGAIASFILANVINSQISFFFFKKL